MLASIGRVRASHASRTLLAIFLSTFALILCNGLAHAQGPARDDARASDAKPLDSKPFDTKTDDAKLPDTKSPEVKPPDAKPVGTETETLKRDTPGKAIKPGQSIRIAVDLALVNITITDPYNRLVTGLEQDNFRVFEDNVEQEVVHFSSEDVPISIGVIFDLSGSMSNKVDKARSAAVQFFKTANPQDEFFLVSFNERAELTSPFTQSVEDLQQRMLYTTAKGRTALLDAIYLGLSEMRGARNPKRALLIISDGGDNHSRYNERDIKNFVKESDVQIYAIGIYNPLGYRPTNEEVNGPTLLSELTELTGGRVFNVENLGDLPDVATKIGMELRNQYVLGYRPSNHTHDSKWRKIKIKLHAPKGLPPLNVYSKTGYYAPSH
ncbi:MAG TPA: VWA domain-containing protein [Candidatus Dormibacteraeota bacterium]|nr:VWA domain-containing protein [Candidatus Dormibacteraeota bacterium]